MTGRRWLLAWADYALRVDGEFVAADGAEQPVLVPLLRWSSPAQVALPAVLRPARRFVPLGRAPRQGTDQIRRSAGDRGRIPCSATERHGPHAKMTLSLAVSCRWRQSRRGGRGSTAPVSEPARPGEPGPGSRRPQRAAGQRARCQRDQPGKRALYAGGAAAGIDLWLPQPVLAVLVSVLDQRQGRHLLVLE